MENSELEDIDEKFIQVERTAEQASMAERRAESATREAVQWLKCEFMSHKIGENLFGIVSSVTEFGLFIELEEFYVDGLVHITSLGQDYYRYDSERRQLIGENSGKTYKTGERLEVQVARVDMEQGRIDFALTDVKNEKFSRGRKGSSSRPKRSSAKSQRPKQGRRRK